MKVPVDGTVYFPLLRTSLPATKLGGTCLVGVWSRYRKCGVVWVLPVGTGYMAHVLVMINATPRNRPSSSSKGGVRGNTQSKGLRELGTVQLEQSVHARTPPDLWYLGLDAVACSLYCWFLTAAATGPGHAQLPQTTTKVVSVLAIVVVRAADPGGTGTAKQTSRG